MQIQSRDAHSATKQKRKRFPWVIGVLVSVVLIVILVFVVVTLLILDSQGVTQGINILTILSIVVGFVVSLLSLLVSFLQWHHPKAPPASEEIIAASVDHLPPLSTRGHPQPDIFLNDTREENIEKKTPLSSSGQKSHRFDWGEAPHIDQLYGRDQELATLKQWMVDDSCRIVAIFGMGGIGKTSLAATLVDQLHEHYDSVFWRSLYNAPPLKNILQECLQFVSDQQQITLPEEVDRQISLLIESLRTYRCLLVLDNVESILQGGSQAGQYRDGYEGYGRLLQRIGESKHQSCLLVTSREKPPEVALQEGEAVATRSLHLEGLKPVDGRDILRGKGLQGAEQDWEVLISHYGGNPLALKLVAQVIREVFGGTITTFLTDGELFFRDVGDVLEQQMKRLSALEEEIIYWFAIEREAVRLSDLRGNIVHPTSKGELQEALRSLLRRQLIETSATGFTLQPVIMEYLTDRLVDQMYEEIRTETLMLFVRHAVMKAQAKEYIRQSQYRLILQPLLQRLLTIFEKEALEQRLQSLLATLHTQRDYYTGYAAGNVLNMLVQMGCVLRDYDFSHLMVRQAYLQGVNLSEVNFAYANLGTSVFTDIFGSILCVAFSPQGDLLAAGTTTGEIRLWQTGGFPLHSFQGHTNWVHAVAFSPDGKTLASGGDDRTTRLWEVSSGKLLNTLQGHISTVRTVAFSPDGKTLASGGDDQMVCLWEISSSQCLHILRDHTHVVWSVAFSPDGKTLVSGSGDQTVRLWEVNSGVCLNILPGHSHWVNSVAFSPDGKMLASGGDDQQAVRLWEVSSGKLTHTLYGHANTIWSVVFSPDGKMLASGGDDQTVHLWEVSSGRVLNILRGHTHEIYSVAFSPDGKTLASGGDDQTVRLWEVNSGKLLNTLQGYIQEVRAVAFSPDGKMLASGSTDQMMYLWEVSSGKLLNTLQGHTSTVRSVAFSPDGKIVASCSADQMVRLWEVSSGKSLNILRGHHYWVSSVAFSPDGKMLASGSDDQTVRLWEVSSGQCLTILRGHSHWINSVAFSPDGSILASGSDDQMVYLWGVSSEKLLNTLQGHTSTVRAVAFSPDGKTLASGSDDQTVRLWEVNSGKLLNTLQSHTSTIRSIVFSSDEKTLACSGDDQTVCLWETGSGKLLNTLQGHTRVVYSVAFSPDGKTLASGSGDRTVCLWEVSSGKLLNTLKSDRLYERMNITQVKGLTEIQKATLRSLGAIENE